MFCLFSSLTARIVCKKHLKITNMWCNCLFYQYIHNRNVYAGTTRAQCQHSEQLGRCKVQRFQWILSRLKDFNNLQFCAFSSFPRPEDESLTLGWL